MSDIVLNSGISHEDQDMLLQILCCVAAADGRVGDKELAVIANALGTIGSTLSHSTIRVLVTEYCKLIHARGVDKFVESLIPSVHESRDARAVQACMVAIPTLTAVNGRHNAVADQMAMRLLAAIKASEERLEDGPGGGLRTRTSDEETITGGMQPWKVAAAIFLFFPLGLYLLLKHPTLRRNRLWWGIALAYSAFVAANALTDKSAPETVTAGSSNAGDSKTNPSYTEGYAFARNKLRQMRDLPVPRKTALMDAMQEGIRAQRGRKSDAWYQGTQAALNDEYDDVMQESLDRVDRMLK